MARSRRIEAFIANSFLILSISACSGRESFFTWRAKYFNDNGGIIELTGTSKTRKDACPDVSEGLKRVPDLSLELGKVKIIIDENCDRWEQVVRPTPSVDNVDQFNFEN